MAYPNYLVAGPRHFVIGCRPTIGQMPNYQEFDDPSNNLCYCLLVYGYTHYALYIIHYILNIKYYIVESQI